MLISCMIINLLLAGILQTYIYFFLIMQMTGTSNGLIYNYIDFFTDYISSIFIILIVGFIVQIILSLLPNKKSSDTKYLHNINIAVLIYKILMIPFFIALVLVCVFVSVASMMVIFLLGVPMLVVPVAIVFGYLALLSSSFCSLRLVAISYKKGAAKLKDSIVSGIFLFIFFTDVISQFYVFSTVRKLCKATNNRE